MWTTGPTSTSSGGLGVVFYELLIGEVPIGRFPLPSETHGTDPRLDEIVLRSLETEPAARYQAAAAMRAALDALGRDEPRWFGSSASGRRCWVSVEPEPEFSIYRTPP